MGIRPGWGWLLLPACQALLVPREVGGQEGETLTLRCWYARGYEGYNKYWCRGAARASCRKVVETAGIEVPVRNGRVSIADNRLFCVVLLTVEELSREDAGSYWCGVERAGWDIMGPVTLTVRAAPSPGPWFPNATSDFPYTTNITAAGAGLQNESLQDGQEPHSSPPSPSGPALQVLLPTVMLLLLLAVVGSAGLICALRRRRRKRKEAPAWWRTMGEVGSSQPCSAALQAQQHHEVAGDVLPPRTKGPAVPCELGITPERDNVYDNELDLRKGTRASSTDSEEQHSELGDGRVYINS